MLIAKLYSKYVWSSKAFALEFPDIAVTLPKPNMRNSDIVLHLLTESKYPIHALVVDLITFISSGGLGPTFNHKTLDKHLSVVYDNAKESGDYNDHEIQLLSSHFTTLMEDTLKDVPSIGSKICSSSLIYLFGEDLLHDL